MWKKIIEVVLEVIKILENWECISVVECLSDPGFSPQQYIQKHSGGYYTSNFSNLKEKEKNAAVFIRLPNP